MHRRYVVSCNLALRSRLASMLTRHQRMRFVVPTVLINNHLSSIWDRWWHRDVSCNTVYHRQRRGGPVKHCKNLPLLDL